MAKEGNRRAEHGALVIEKEIGQIRAATAETHADRGAGTDEYRSFGQGGEVFGGDDVYQATVGIDFWNGVEAKVEQFEQVFP